MSAITYSKHGDYQIPDITIPEQAQSLGRFGMMRKDYLNKHRGILYSVFAMKGTLFPHCLEIEGQANERLERMMEQLIARMPPPDKSSDPMGWTAHMNNLKAQAEEAIVREWIYS
jgi:hypothetical protein